MAIVRSEVLPVGALAEDVADEATRASPSPLQAPALARAFEAAGGNALMLRVLDGEAVLAHALLLETRPLGFGTWAGLGAPVLRPGARPGTVWAALVAAGRARGVVSASWRDLTLTRLDDEALGAARAACEALGGAASSIPFQAQRLDLARPLDALWAGLHRKHRNAVRLAEAAGVETGPVPCDGFAEAYAPLADATWARSGREGPPAAYYESLVRNDGILPYLARDANGAPVAGAIVALGAGGAAYLHGASSNAQSGASTLLQWRILRDLHERGIPAYDLGGDAPPGAPDDTPRAAGIRRFKERFGGEAHAWQRLHLQLDPAAYERARAALAASLPRGGVNGG